MKEEGLYSVIVGPLYGGVATAQEGIHSVVESGTFYSRVPCLDGSVKGILGFLVSPPPGITRLRGASLVLSLMAPNRDTSFCMGIDFLDVTIGQLGVHI